MSDNRKLMVVWIPEGDTRLVGISPLTVFDEAHHRDGDVPFLLLPIEDGALRVGSYLFRRPADVVEHRTDSDPPGEWYEADAWDLVDLLMDAVEGVEP